MPVTDHPRYATGDHLTAAGVNRILAELQRGGKVTATPPIMVYDGPAGTAIGFMDPEFWAVVCSVSGDGYHVRELRLGPGGTFSVMENGREGQGYEANGNGVPLGAVVRAFPGADPGEFVFVNCCTGVNRKIDCTPPSASGSAPGSSSLSSSSSGSSSSSSSSGSSCEPGSQQGCIPLLARVWCSSGVLQNEYQYLTQIGGNWWLFQNNQCSGCPQSSSSSLSSSSESSASSFSSLSSGSSSSSSSGSLSSSSSSSSSFSSQDFWYCVQVGSECGCYHNEFPSGGTLIFTTYTEGGCTSYCACSSSDSSSSATGSNDWYCTPSGCRYTAYQPGYVGPFADQNACNAADCQSQTSGSAGVE